MNEIAEYKPKPETDGAWIRQPLSVLRRDGGLTKAAAVTLAVLIDRATDYDPPRPVAASVSALAWSTGYSGRTVRDALKELERAELIAVQRTGRASVYTLTGAVELLPPKKRHGDQTQQQQRQQQRRSSRPRRSSSSADGTIGGFTSEDYLSLSNRFREDWAPCSDAATPGADDYEL